VPAAIETTAITFEGTLEATLGAVASCAIREGFLVCVAAATAAEAAMAAFRRGALFLAGALAGAVVAARRRWDRDTSDRFRGRLLGPRWSCILYRCRFLSTGSVEGGVPEAGTVLKIVGF
jgi:hypothetical protein